MVDESLAHCQARHLTRELRAEWDRVWSRDLISLGIDRTVPSEGKAAKALDKVQAHLLGTRAIAVHKYGPLSRVAYVEYAQNGDTLILEWELFFRRVQRHHYDLDAITYTALILEPHAVARVLQRKQSLEGETVARELLPAVGAIQLVSSAVQVLELKQFAIPTASGLVAGIVEERARGVLLRAKTFMTQLSPERQRLRDAMSPHVFDVHASMTFARPEFMRRHEALTQVLRSHAWLKQPLSRGTDPEAGLWANAPTRTGA
jgi:hypothetical protein